MVSTLRVRARLTTVCAVALLGLTLVGCGGDDEADESGAAVREQTCRTYLLAVAGDDRTSVQLVSDAVETDSYASDFATPLEGVIAAAGKAGAAPGLPKEDFEVFLALTDAAGAALAAVTTDGVPLVADVATALDDAVTAVREQCEG